MKTINRVAVLVQRMVEGIAIAKRVNAAGEREFLLHWEGSAGEVHEQWFPESLIKLED